MKDLNFLFKKRINWQSVQPGKAEWYAEIEGERIELRMNDFPDEPLYTVIFRGESFDFDDKPIAWIVPLND